jgi:hypothetical protein
MNKIPASLRSDFSDCRFAPESVPLCFGIGGDFIGIRSVRAAVLTIEIGCDSLSALRLFDLCDCRPADWAGSNQYKMQ